MHELSLEQSSLPELLLVLPSLLYVIPQARTRVILLPNLPPLSLHSSADLLKQHAMEGMRLQKALCSSAFP